MKRQLLSYLSLLALLASFSSARGNNQPVEINAVRTELTQQIEPKKKEVTATISRSLENEAITLSAFFPEDADNVRVAIYNILGKLIEVDPTTSVTKGNYTFLFRTVGLPNGPYLVILEASGQRITTKIMLSR